MGRKSTLTPAMHQRIMKLVRAGNFFDVAAGASGIAESTLWLWIQKGQQVSSKLEDNPDYCLTEDEVKYLEFSEDLFTARDECEAELLGSIAERGACGQKVEVEWDADGNPTKWKWEGRDWRAAAWFLERTRKKRYAGIQSVELTGADGGPVELDLVSPILSLQKQMTEIESRQSETKELIETTASES